VTWDESRETPVIGRRSERKERRLAAVFRTKARQLVTIAVCKTQDTGWKKELSLRKVTNKGFFPRWRGVISRGTFSVSVPAVV
jgi:hypothetical protein